jgi:hypothetical protein
MANSVSERNSNAQQVDASPGERRKAVVGEMVSRRLVFSFLLLYSVRSCLLRLDRPSERAKWRPLLRL